MHHAPPQHHGSPYGNELMAEYESALQELTFNSKPLINNLTIIAGENMAAAEQVVACIEKRLYNAPPGQKLPLLYLLDSIVKNIGGAYHELFQRNIVSTFRLVYDAVDEPTKAAMQRLLGTWTTVWPRKAQLIQERLPGVASAGTSGASRSGIHINPAYLAKIQGQQNPPPQQAHGRPPTQRHAQAPAQDHRRAQLPSQSGSHRSPPRKRGRSPPPARFGGPHKSARHSPPDRVTEILAASHHPADHYSRELMEGRDGPDHFRPRHEDPRMAPRMDQLPPHQPPMHQGFAPPMVQGPLPGYVQPPMGIPPAQPVLPPGGHQAILSEAHVLMQQLEQRLQAQLLQPGIDRNDVMRQMGQLRVLQQQANQILINTQPGQPAPVAAPSLAQNLPGLGQGPQARENILSLLQGALAGALPAQPPVSAPVTYPPSVAPSYNPAGISGLSPPSSATSAPTSSTMVPNVPSEDIIKNLMNLGMFGALGAQSAPMMEQPAPIPVMPPAAAPGMLSAPTQPLTGPVPPLTLPVMPVQPMPGMPVPTYPQGAPQPTVIPGMPPIPTPAIQPTSMGPYGTTPAPFETSAKHFRPELATPHEQVNKLYADFELQCGTCGLRYNDKEKLAKHLDWHFAVHKKEKQKTKKAISRLWFSTSEEWAEGVEAAEKQSVPFFGVAESAAGEAAEAPVMNVVADETQPNCGICSEKFDQFWDNDLEEWMYRGAVKVEGTGQIFHQQCYQQAFAMSQQQESSSSSPPSSTSSAASSTPTAADPSVGAGANGTASSTESTPFWVKKEPEGEIGEGRGPSPPPDNRDTTTTPAEGPRASVVS